MRSEITGMLVLALVGCGCGSGDPPSAPFDSATPPDSGPSSLITGPNYPVVSGDLLEFSLPSPAYALVSVTRDGEVIALPGGASYSDGTFRWTPSADGVQSGLYQLVFRDDAADVIEPWLWVASSRQVCNPSWVSSTDGLDGQRVIDRSTCDLLNSLYAGGTIAGNVGDLYDNRDGTHVNLCEGWNPATTNGCPLDHRLFPQHDWLFTTGFGSTCAPPPSTPHPRATFGQESCAGTPDFVHGIAYTYYVGQSEIDRAYDLYTASNLYAFPTLDDDGLPGGQTTDPSILADPVVLDRNKINIANSPYVLGTKEVCTHVYGGSAYSIHHASGSDLPFVKLMLAASASLRPEVKRALLTGATVGGRHASFFAPVIQMLLRNAHTSIQFDRARYLGGPAHRSGYVAHYLAGGLPQPAYDAASLVAHASALTVADIPPFAHVRVVSETFSGAEQRFTTPGSIARSVPYGTPARTLTVSAAGSADLTGTTSGLVYEWRVLDSDPSKVTIAVNAADPAEATLTFHPGASTDRVDVGVFVTQPGGAYYSVPAMITNYIHP